MGLPLSRWHGENTVLMDLERYAVEEATFLEFTEWLTRANQDLPAREPAWLESAPASN